ncbi:MAG TPA: VapC toxin family PIN domain ribonuclease [Acidobacteria bacterium]|nr:VapC toxin family PIN domain ribonuclease [Acidobacteriota bacterium]
MSFLLDTNVISEWIRPLPEPAIVSWLSRIDEDRVFLSVASLAEIRHGIELLAPGHRRRLLETWLAETLPARFEGRILDINPRVAVLWGEIMARGRRAGRPVGAMDAFFAATAEAHAMTLVTRNTRDFEALGIKLLDPANRSG